MEKQKSGAGFAGWQACGKVGGRRSGVGCAESKISEGLREGIRKDIVVTRRNGIVTGREGTASITVSVRIVEPKGNSYP